MPWPCKATNKAEAFLNRLQSAEHPNGRPQSIADLAAQAGVSYATMWKAVARLRQVGKVRGSYRLTIGESEPSDPGRIETQPPFPRIVERMTGDLLSGTIIRQGHLLSVKELTGRYACSARTLRRACEHLRCQGLIFPRGRHFEGLPVHRSSRKIALIIYTYARDVLDLPVLEVDFLRRCEQVCAHALVTLEVIALRPHDNHLVFTHSVAGREVPIPDADGFLYVLYGQETFDDSIMHRLCASRKPVAILDQSAAFPLDRPEYNLSRIRVFTASAREQPGRDICRFLLSKGHRNLAYISPFHADVWSKNRCAGVRQVIDSAGRGFSLQEFTIDKSAKSADFNEVARSLSKGDRLQSIYSSWQSTVDPRCHWDTDSMAHTGIPLLLWATGTRLCLYPILEKALVCKDITAWVMANDIVAKMAWEYCIEKGIPVPQKLAIVGFDDTVPASTSRITSYCFNFDAVAATILNFLLSPAGRFWSRRRVVEISGKVMQRESA